MKKKQVEREEKFEPIRDEVERVLSRAERTYALRHGLVDASVFRKEDLGIVRAAKVQQARDRGVVGEDIQKAILKVAGKEPESKAKIIVSRALSHGFYSYLRFRRFLGVPKDSFMIGPLKAGRRLPDLIGLVNPGGLVWVKEGSYPAAVSPIAVNENVAVEGTGRATVIAPSTGITSVFTMANYSALKSVFIDAIGTDRIGVVTNGGYVSLLDVFIEKGATGIKVLGDSGTESVFQRCTLRNQSSYGIWLSRTTTPDLGGLYVIDCNVGNPDLTIPMINGLRIECASPTSVFVHLENTIIDNICGTSSIYGKNAYEVVAEDCWLAANGTLTGPVLDFDSCGAIRLHDNKIVGLSTAPTDSIKFNNCYDVMFQGNRTDLRGQHSIGVYGTFSSSLRILGDHLTNDRKPNYCVYFGPSCSVASLQISNNTAVGSTDLGDYFIFVEAGASINHPQVGENVRVNCQNYINTVFPTYPDMLATIDVAAGASAGYIHVQINGVEYKIPIFNT